MPQHMAPDRLVVVSEDRVTVGFGAETGSSDSSHALLPDAPGGGSRLLVWDDPAPGEDHDTVHFALAVDGVQPPHPEVSWDSLRHALVTGCAIRHTGRRAPWFGTARIGDESMYVMALDQGTTSSRAIVFDRRGTIRSLAQRETTQLFPQPGWVEQDAREIWVTQSEVAEEALRAAGIDGSRIAAVGITNQRETTVIWDRRTGEPVGNAIVWQDRRTAAVCEELRRAGVEELVRAKTGLCLGPVLLGHQDRLDPGVCRRRARAGEAGELAFGTVDSC